MSRLLSLVVPCYRVARYLPAFLASIDSQSLDRSRFEVVFVVDGCPEGSEAILRQWQENSDVRAQILVTPNRGVSAARNAGIEVASGHWISFPDPDDRLGEGYLSKVVAATNSHSEVALIATRLTLFSETSGEFEEHQLDYRYSCGSRSLDLEDEPAFLQLAVHTAIFRRSVIEDHGVRFDPRVRAFEDGKFVAEYLLACEVQTIYVEVDAPYLYTKRADDTSALARSDQDPLGRYRESIRFAHLEILSSAGAEPPRWLQNFVLYDLYWLFSPFLSIRNPVHGADHNDLNEVADLATSALRCISIDAIMEFAVVQVLPEVRAAWLIGSAGVIPERWVCTVRHDIHQGLREYRYFCSSLEFEALAEGAAKPIEPKFEKWREVSILGKVWLYERLIWVEDAHSIRFAPNEASVEAGEGLANAGRPRALAEHTARFGWNPTQLPTTAPANPMTRKLLFRLKIFVWRAIARFWGRLPRWQDAWVFIDRDTKAGDNAEAMFRAVRELRPTVNAYFVLGKHSPDFSRLRREGYRVLSHHSLRHFIAMRRARFLISSQIDHYIVQPFDTLGLGKNWDFIFLQHGVTQNSLHRWLNSKDVQMLIAATPDEYDAFVESPGPYNLTSHETVLTGFPRHDTLFRKMRQSPDKSLFLIMPTWRQYLTTNPTTTEGNERQIDQEFANSEYVREWRAFLNDPRLLDICTSADLTPAILPHPTFEQYLEYFEVPQTIQQFSYTTDDVQEALASSAFTMTDYSSQAFEGAFCGAPTIYFQFDRETFFGGGHIASPGYFDYDHDGLGPVVLDVDEAMRALNQLVTGTHPMQQKYRDRIESLYAYRDDKATQRILNEMTKRLGA